MPSFAASLLRCLVLPLGFWLAQEPPGAPAKPVFPRTAGVYAMTAQGPVSMKISGERNTVNLALGPIVVYSRGDLDRIPAADTVQSFFVNMVNWQPKDLYLVVGRDHLTDPLKSYQRLTGRMVTRGIVAFQIVSNDLEPAFLAQAVRRLAPGGSADVEAYLVLELRSTAELNDRAYPVRITVPKQ